MSPKGGIKPHNKFSVPSNRAEVLFVDYIINHLRPKGRAGIIVPEGIIFQSGNAYKALRKYLIENGLYAVVSLPGGVFQPYSGVKTSILLIDNELAKQKSEIAFVKITADGYDLGATKREVSQNDLPLALESLKAWASGKKIENTIFTLVSKEEIAEKDGYNLSGDRYKKGVNSLNSEFGRVALKDVITLDFGDRITKKNEAGDKYPVYGGGGESFRTDNFNRQDELIIARFAMGPNCVRFVSGQFWLMDSGASYSLTEDYEGKFTKKFVDHVLINIQDEIYQCARGGAQKNLHLEKFYELEIPMPPLEVQEQVVAELDGYAAIISGAKQIVENWKPRIDIDPEWDSIVLGDLVDLQNGFAFKSSDYVENSSVMNFRMSQIRPGGFIDLQHNPKFLPNEFAGQYSDYQLNPGDVVIAMTDMASDPKILGVPTIIEKSDFTLLMNQRVGKLFGLDESKATYEYLGVILKSENVRQFFNSLGAGGVQVNISKNQILSIKLPIPPIEVQRTIIHAINLEEESVKAAKSLIELYEARTQAVIAKLWSE